MLEKGAIIMTTVLTIKTDQMPSEETLERLSKLNDDDIIYDDDCPELTPKMQKALACATAQRNRLKRLIH